MRSQEWKMRDLAFFAVIAVLVIIIIISAIAIVRWKKRLAHGMISYSFCTIKR